MQLHTLDYRYYFAALFGTGNVGFRIIDPRAKKIQH
jgi:hypothetical protein